MRSIIYLFILLFNISILAMEVGELPTIDHLIKALQDNNSMQTQQIVSANPDLVNHYFSMRLVTSLEFDYPVTPLHIAEKKCAKVLLKNGADVNARCSYGETPLDRALLHDDNIPLALFLMKSGATVNNVDNRGNTLLHRVIEYDERSSTVVPFLLKHGAHVEARNGLGKTPLDIAILKHSKSVKLFEKAGIMFIHKDDNPLHDPYKLLQNNAALFQKNRWLHFPYQRDEKTRMECRLAKLFIFIQKWGRKQSISDSPSTYGISTNRRGYCFTKPTFEDLCEWVGKDAVERVKKYFNRRCEKAYKILTTDPHTFLNIVDIYPYIVSYKKEKILEYIMNTMTKDEHRSFITEIIKYVKDINFRYTSGHTLLHRAVICNNPLFLELLMKRNINFTCKGLGGTVLCLAKEYGRNQCIDSFYESLAKRLSFYNYCFEVPQEKTEKFLSKYCDLERRNEKGETLLLMLCNHFICRNHWFKFLLELGARVNVKNNAGKSPLDIIVSYEDITTIKLFLKYSAIVTQTMISESLLLKEQEILQAAYDEQHCIVCYEHPETLGEIPCKNRHVGSFLCQECYNGIKNRDCPFRCGKLKEFAC